LDKKGNISLNIIIAKTRINIAAVLPVTNSGLPAGPDIIGAQGTPVSNFRDYLSTLVTGFYGQTSDGFTPGLLKLDDLIRLIEVR
jgi:hypothetical protein